MSLSELFTYVLMNFALYMPGSCYQAEFFFRIDKLGPFFTTHWHSISRPFKHVFFLVRAHCSL